MFHCTHQSRRDRAHQRSVAYVMLVVVHEQSFQPIDAPEGGTNLVTLHLSATSHWIGYVETYTLAGLEVNLP